MMNKFPIISTAIMVVAFIVAVFLSKSMKAERTKIFKDNPERMTMKYVPVMGMEKFYADIEWIRLIQDMGDPETKMKEDKEGRGKKAAEFFYGKLDKITSLSPDSNKIYLVGARHISNLKPKLSIALLDKGNRLSTEKDWKRYQYMAFVEDQYVGKKLKDDDETGKMESMKKSMAYLRSAIDSGSTPSYVESAWLRHKAYVTGMSNDEVGKFLMAADHYIQKVKLNSAENGEDMAMTATGIDGENDGLRTRIIQDAQEIAVNIWKKSQTASAAEKAKLSKDLKDIREKYDMITTKEHYSPVSLIPYAAGDRFDAATGTPVKVYGICPFCDKEGKTVVTKGDYCHVCGKKVR